MYWHLFRDEKILKRVRNSFWEERDHRSDVLGKYQKLMVGIKKSLCLSRCPEWCTDLGTRTSTVTLVSTITHQYVQLHLHVHLPLPESVPGTVTEEVTLPGTEGPAFYIYTSGLTYLANNSIL